MDPWVWIVAYLVGFALLQLLLYRYVRQEVPQSESTTPPSTDAGNRHAQSPSTATGADEVTCPHCGTINQREQTFTRCKQCVSPLH